MLDGAPDQSEVTTRDSTLPDVWIADVDATKLPVGAVIRFAIRAADGTVDGGHTVTVVPRT
jgi:hypothetical protein